MKKLIYGGLEFKAEKIIKTETYIVGYDINGIEVFAFRGISDFTGFTLDDGQEFDKEEPTQDEILRAKIIKDGVMMQLQLAQQQKINANLLAQIAKLGGVK